MKTWQSYTYPTFMGLCGLLAAFSDIIQNAMVANGVIIGLAAIGGLFVIFGRRIFSIKLVSQALGSDYEGLSPRPFGLSCLVLALLMSGWSYLSVNSASANGLIGSAVPEIGQLQEAFGWINKKLDHIAAQNSAIKEDTTKLVASSRDWLSISAHPSTRIRVTKDWKNHYFPAGVSARLDNETNFNFDEIQIVIRDARSKKIVASEQLTVFARDQWHEFNEEAETSPSEIELCLSARNSARNEWVVEKRKLALFQKTLESTPEYRATELGEPRVFRAQTKCL